MRNRQKTTYFERIPGAPEPVVVDIKRRVHFNEADPMAIVWHGRYPLFFEEAAEEWAGAAVSRTAIFSKPGFALPWSSCTSSTSSRYSLTRVYDQGLADLARGLEIEHGIPADKAELHARFRCSYGPALQRSADREAYMVLSRAAGEV